MSAVTPPRTLIYACGVTTTDLNGTEQVRDDHLIKRSLYCNPLRLKAGDLFGFLKPQSGSEGARGAVAVPSLVSRKKPQTSQRLRRSLRSTGSQLAEKQERKCAFKRDYVHVVV